MADETIVSKKIRTLTITIDRSLCIGAATCVTLAPKAWKLDDQGKAVLLQTAQGESDQTLVNAAKGCPVAAITITDENGNHIAP